MLTIAIITNKTKKCNRVTWSFSFSQCIKKYGLAKADSPFYMTDTRKAMLKMYEMDI